MAALAAAKIENLAVRLNGSGGGNEIHLAARVLIILDHVAVGLDVQRIEKLAPPFGGEMLLEIRDRPEA